MSAAVTQQTEKKEIAPITIRDIEKVNPDVAVKKITRMDDEEYAWMQELEWIKGGTHISGIVDTIDPNNLHNLRNIILYHPSLKGILAYDMFADCISFVKCPPWEDSVTFLPRPASSHDNFKLRWWYSTLQVNSGRKFNLSVEQAEDLLREAAYNNTVNPPKDYFEKLLWDGTERLDKWLSDYLGAKQDEYTAFVGRKWMVAAVKRIYEPGCKFENLLVLEGSQGIGKSLALRTLATFGEQCYFTDESINFHSDKDSLLKLQGRLIIELSELASWRKAEQEDIKAFVSRQVDSYREPYGRKIKDRPRMFVLAGTTNQISGWLMDETGNRRYWPIKCSTINIEGLAKDAHHLWAEAVHLYKKKEQVWLTAEEYRVAQSEQDDRVAVSILHDDVERAMKKIDEKFSRHTQLTHLYGLSEIMDEMGVHAYQKTNKLAAEIKRDFILRGFKEYRRTVNGKTLRVWGLE